MEPFELLILLAFAAIVAILYLKGQSYIIGTTWGQKFYGTGTFFRAAAVATVVIFGALLTASFILGSVGERPRLP